MSFKPVENRTIEVICSRDGSIGAPEMYQAYLKHLDEDLLELKEDSTPTRFVLKTVLDYKCQQKIKNMQISYSDGDVDLKLGFVIEEIRMSLIDIKDPGAESIKFKKEGDTYASKRLMSILESNGIINDLYNARQHAMEPESGEDPKKKSQPSLSSPSQTAEL